MANAFVVADPVVLKAFWRTSELGRFDFIHQDLACVSSSASVRQNSYADLSRCCLSAFPREMNISPYEKPNTPMWGVLGNIKQKLIEKLVVSREAPLVVERKPWGHHSPGLSLLHPFGDGSAMSCGCKKVPFEAHP